MKSPSEKRMSDRIPYDKPLSVELGSVHYKSIGVDISNDGLGLIAGVHPEKGDVMKVSLAVAVGIILPVFAEVMWSKPLAEHSRIGLRFI
jgi:hypothetical protein